MIMIGDVVAVFNSSDETDTSLQPQACPSSDNDTDDYSFACVYDPLVMSTLSYQSVMYAFMDLIVGTISLGDEQSVWTLPTSTSQLGSTVLAEAPELAFLRSNHTLNEKTAQSLQQGAAT